MIFESKVYKIDDKGERIIRIPGVPFPQNMQVETNEQLDKMAELARYVEAKIVSEFQFVYLRIPEEIEEGDDGLSTTILASPNWQTASKLLVIIQNSSGSLIGICSRSSCFDHGLSKGTWIPYIKRAIETGYAVLLLRPNTNFVTNADGEKVQIKGSETPEIHALNVWTNIVSKAEMATHIALLGFGNGASLCKDLFLSEIVNDDKLKQLRIKAMVTIAASHMVEKDDDADTKALLGGLVVNLESNVAPRGYQLGYRKVQLGCTSISLGLPPGESEFSGDALAVHLALEPVFRYLQICEEGKPGVSKQFCSAMAADNRLDERTAVIVENPNVMKDIPQPPSPASNTPPPPKPAGFLSKLFFGEKTAAAGSSASGKNSGKDEGEEKLTVNDFDLLKIVGKGAFGKVMLVRKKSSQDEGKIYAMKVLKKSVIAAKGQIEHTKSERDILFEVRHPYIVRLRYAFQSDDKLYLVTDYYNGGTLFYHLRKSRSFNEERARFYAAELLSALDHLHQQSIIYRDLKLENILMDHQGHLALTDFGLSKQNIDSAGGATTFCGTAEYIAPELLKGLKYGPPVDWWSFGILLFEMMYGRTPFVDKNRKLMFHRIINSEPNIPPTFSPEAAACVRGLLRVNEFERLGSGPDGAREIMRTAFFAPINFDLLMERALPPPFVPDVVNEFDTKYVPKPYLEAEAKDSVDETSLKRKKGQKVAANPKFDAFTYQGGSALDN